MVDEADTVRSGWPEHGTITVGDEMRRLTFAVLTQTLFDLDREAVPDLHDDFEAVATKLRPFNAVVPDWLPTPTNIRYKRSLSRLRATIEDLLAERQRSGSGADDLLSMLVEANTQETGKQTLSDERIRDEMMGFLFAGHETTAMALTFACYLLATHRSVQRRLRTEIETVLDDKHPCVAVLPEFTYLDHVVNEALRLYPPNHMIPRESVADVEIGGYRIPAESSVYCSQWVVHRDERWWDSPERFRPERWAPEDGLTTNERPEYAYFPFGGGPRHCIGMRFARMEIRLTLIRLLSEFVLADVPSGEPTLAAGLTTHPVDPIEMTVRREENS
jgi:cytochrome P450